MAWARSATGVTSPASRMTDRTRGPPIMGSLGEQGVALADRVARVHLHGFGHRLEAGMLDAQAVAARLDRVFDDWRLSDVDAVDVDLAERIGRDREEALSFERRRWRGLARLRPWSRGRGRERLHGDPYRILNPDRIDCRSRRG